MDDRRVAHFPLCLMRKGMKFMSVFASVVKQECCWATTHHNPSHEHTSGMNQIPSSSELPAWIEGDAGEHDADEVLEYTCKSAFINKQAGSNAALAGLILYTQPISCFVFK